MTAATANDTNSVNSSASAEANEIVSKAVKWSAAAAVIPLPYVDLISLGAVQLNMVRDLGKLYDVDAKDEVIKSAISALLGTLGPAALSGSIVGSSLKLIPGGGTLLGSAGLAAAGSAATYAIGQVFISHFEDGGTVENLDAESKADEVASAVNAAKSK
ncbi:YcjF family protein [Tateyamaria sp. SN3-11]|uniref:YcjF family protein n=1 Tax=Tateyamaria sp. SN3-11 TaxID=3092147 RepID=UPI0039E73515